MGTYLCERAQATSVNDIYDLRVFLKEPSILARKAEDDWDIPMAPSEIEMREKIYATVMPVVLKYNLMAKIMRLMLRAEDI